VACDSNGPLELPGEMIQQAGWPELFWAAFKDSRSPMVLLDDRRLVVEVNGAFLKLGGYAREDVIGQPGHRFVVAGPVLSSQEWAARLAVGHFTGETELICADGATVLVLWGAHTEVVTGRRLVLLVALSSSRWGRHFRRSMPSARPPGELSEREREVVRLVAQGQTGSEIAEELRIADDTGRTHVRNAMAKLGARSRAHLVAKALGDGIVL
jgi:PAS domain S-box-containing protein